MNHDNPSIQDICRKIDREKAIINATLRIRNATDNDSVKSRIESQIREARRNINYFEQLLLEMNKLSIAGGESVPTSPTHRQPSPFEPGPINSLRHSKYSDNTNPEHEGYISGELSGQMQTNSTLTDESFWALPSYSKMDLIKYDTKHLGPRIKLMLSHLTFKLSIERQYKDVVEKMIALYQMEGDHKSKEEAIFQRTEIDQKIQLITGALRKYNELTVKDKNEATEDNKFEIFRERKPLTGDLSIRIHAVTDVDHVVYGKSNRRPEMFVSMKIDESFRGRTKATRTGSWAHENYEFDVERANEVEFTVYEKANAEDYMPIGLLWFKLSDLADEIRRRRVEVELHQAGLHGTSPRSALGFQQSRHAPEDKNSTTSVADAFSASFNSTSHSDPMKIDGWFSLEPVGRIQLTLGFIKQAKDAGRRFDAGLHRKGAVRQKKQNAVGHCGHKFKLQTFYSIMRCATCEELLKNTVGMQCEECKYTCHQKCYPKFTTQCVLSSGVDAQSKESKINHRIPHLFEPFSSIGPNWCCHCGYILPVSKRHSRKCSSCKTTCHADCIRFVPDFCGMSVELAHNILAELSKIAEIGRSTQLLQKRHIVSAPAPQDAATPHEDLQHMQAPPNVSLQTSLGHHNMIPQDRSQHLRNGHSRDEGRMPASDKQLLQTFSVGPYAAQTSTTPQNKAVEPAHSHSPATTKGHLGLAQFEFVAVLGRGNFGKVMLAELKTTRRLYAIKVLKKASIIENDDIESTRAEKRVFLIANKERHPFLYNLHASFQTETRIYFVMEYISGGDLMLHIQREPFGTDRSRFYATEICLALKYLHENGVIYRDLKLDNILLTADGHIKLADYGLCKDNMWYGSTTSTFCGTPEFMAPEIILGIKYGTAVDWWAFGVLLYQMLLQQSPFRGDDEEEIYDAILTDEPLFPIHMQQDSISILKRLLTRQPESRLGAGPTDAAEVMSHPFFRDTNWEHVYHKRLPVPFVPTVRNRKDTCNFDAEFTSTEPALTPVHSVLSDAMQEHFRGFSYSADSDCKGG